MKKIIRTELILEYMAKHNLSMTRFCGCCGITINAFKKIMAQDTTVFILSLFKVAKFLGIKFCEIFQ